jgi:hypothetical protein
MAARRIHEQLEYRPIIEALGTSLKPDLAILDWGKLWTTDVLPLFHMPPILKTCLHS